MYLDKRIGEGCYIPLRADLKRVVVKRIVFFRENVGNSQFEIESNEPWKSNVIRTSVNTLIRLCRIKASIIVVGEKVLPDNCKL